MKIPDARIISLFFTEGMTGHAGKFLPDCFWRTRMKKPRETRTETSGRYTTSPDDGQTIFSRSSKSKK
jgi:hypothetical protein